MEYCNAIAGQWHHAPRASIAPPHPQPPQRAPHYNGSYFFGGDGRANYHAEQAPSQLLDATYQQYRASAMSVATPPNAAAANGGCANVAVVASGSGANGYGHSAPMGYPHSSAPSNAATNNYGYIEALQPAGHPAPEGASPQAAALYAQNAFQLNQAR